MWEAGWQKEPFYLWSTALVDFFTSGFKASPISRDNG